MAITNKEEGVWVLDEVYNKIMEGDIWDYDGEREFWVSGADGDGALALNTSCPAPGCYRSSPVQVGTDVNWASVITNSMADGECGALKTDGSLWVWGRNEHGELGQNNLTRRSSPTQIPGTWGAGGQRTSQHGFMAAKTDGTMWVWGRNGDGGLGQNQGYSPANQGSRSSPTQVGTDTNWSTTSNNHYATNAAGGCFAIKTDGTLWSWGGNNSGSLGHNLGANPGHCSSPTQIGVEATWSAVTGGNGMAAIKTDGTLWVWGGNDRGQLGLNTAGDNAAKSSPIQLGTATTWRSVTMGQKNVWYTKTDGTLWGCGQNNWGQLGQNQPETSLYSSPVQIGADTNWGTTHSGSYGVMALKTDGTAWTWGNDNAGSSGHNNVIDYSSPTQLGTDTNWVSGSRRNNKSMYMIKLK